MRQWLLLYFLLVGGCEVQAIGFPSWEFFDASQGIRSDEDAEDTRDEMIELVFGEPIPIRFPDEVRLHSAIGYVTPLDKMSGRESAIFSERDRKLEEARRKRQENRARQRANRSCYTEDALTEDRATVGTDPSAEPGPEARPGGPMPPRFPSPDLSLLAQSDKSQGVWGTASPN